MTAAMVKQAPSATRQVPRNAMFIIISPLEPARAAPLL
jgi:hypothetical protein